MQPFGERPRGERGGVDPVQRIVVRLGDVQVGRRTPDRERPVVRAGGQPVGQRPVESEPGQHVPGGQCREVAQGTHPEPAEQVGQGRPAECRDGQSGEELPGTTGWDDPAGPGRQPGGHLLDCGEDRLEGPGIATGVVLDGGQLWATALRLAFA